MIFFRSKNKKVFEKSKWRIERNEPFIFASRRFIADEAESLRVDQLEMSMEKAAMRISCPRRLPESLQEQSSGDN